MLRTRAYRMLQACDAAALAVAAAALSVAAAALFESVDA